MEEWFQEGRQMVFPKMEMIRLRARIDKALQELHRAVQARWVTPTPTVPTVKPQAAAKLPSGFEMTRTDTGRYQVVSPLKRRNMKRVDSDFSTRELFNHFVM